MTTSNEHNNAPAVPQGRPFGHFRAEPFGWTDCAATDDGAIALYERPAAHAVPQGEPVYQLARATGPVADAWIDVAKDVYDDAGFHPSDFKRRILYATPAAPSQPVTLTDGLIEKGAMTGMVDAQIDDIIAALREKEAKATP